MAFFLPLLAYILINFICCYRLSGLISLSQSELYVGDQMK